jgi:hypothetical protein
MVSMNGTNASSCDQDIEILRFIKKKFLINLAILSFPRITLFNGTGFILMFAIYLYCEPIERKQT